MNFSNFKSSAYAFTLAMFAIVLTQPMNLPAQSDTTPLIYQSMFPTPEAAVAALRDAVESRNQGALEQIFGPQIHSLMTGDKVEDANNEARFAAALDQGVQLDKDNPNEVIVDAGTNNWPMPIPLMQTNGQWYFDTAAGKEEIIDRHIGKDEFTAIGVCRDYVTAQREYASMNGGVYAQKFKSDPGTRDGLYWPPETGQPPSPFGPLVAEAHAEGYGRHSGTGPHPFEGYIFKILTCQGKAAPGGKLDYISDGSLKNGFALVAYPDKWDDSGVMTFIVNQDGQVYQRNLGEKTSHIASKMKEYNPDKNWSLVQDQGIPDSTSEK